MFGFLKLSDPAVITRGLGYLTGYSKLTGNKNALAGQAGSASADQQAKELMRETFFQYPQDLQKILQIHFDRAIKTWRDNAKRNFEQMENIGKSLFSGRAPQASLGYAIDAGQRAVLFADALRRRGNYFVEHEEGSDKTVLSWPHETIVEGTKLRRPVNYSLVQIIPPAEVPTREEGRPYIIIDPRAGHGSGIGGFKDESEVGAAIYQGNPVYFVTFTRLPQPGQTLADVCAAEAEFARVVRRRHPSSPRPIIVGNCQGGWAAMFLVATNPDITGPVVANGAPLSYWAGQKGDDPMRYMGGLTGGAVTPKLLADLGNGLFDGAHLVFNFERLSPADTWWSKYYHLWDNIDSEVERFVGFERWWSSFYYMTDKEINWIIENLFVGNTLAHGKANLDARTHLDLRNINSPIIVFASHGDNITPPQQALGWIDDIYSNVDEIKVRGQRIVYTLHDQVGHLGIFVSSSVANKEHKAIVSTLEVIEALPPGLYEMVITEATGEGINKHFKVAFQERSITQMMAQCGGDDSDLPFATIARISQLNSELYEFSLGPLIRATSNALYAELLSQANPMRLQRRLQSDKNPLMKPIPKWADWVRNHRQAAAAENPFRQMERFAAGLVTQALQGIRAAQDLLVELNFHLLWASPMISAIGKPIAERISEAPKEELTALASVQDALDRLEEGDYPEGLVRMLILLAQSRGEVRRSRLEKANELLESVEPFASMRLKHRTRLIHRQSLIVAFAGEDALLSLPKLITDEKQRKQALAICLQVAGPEEEMHSATVAMMGRLAEVLEVSSVLKEEGLTV